MNNYQFYGPFKEDIIKYLDYRVNILQLKASPNITYLKQFDTYTLDNNINVFNRENIDKWLELKENESLNSLRLRAYTLRCFGKYLKLINKETYIVDTKQYQYKTKYIPHIYTKKEIDIFFKQIDKTIHNTISLPYKKQQYKLFYKTLYCCGLRDSELLKLKYSNVNFEENTILIKNSKNGIDRLIYISDELSKDFKKLFTKYSDNNIDSYIFSNSDTHKPLSGTHIRNDFYTIIRDAGFDNNIRYRIHDFRHTFAVINIKEKYEAGIDIYAFLPVLMKYMGHSNIISTEYYLRFTPDIYETVTNQVSKYFENIIPKVRDEDANIN